MTNDMWHMTHATQGVVIIASQLQVSSSNGLGEMVLWGFRGNLSVEWRKKIWMKYEDVCRTAPATQDLLNIVKNLIMEVHWWEVLYQNACFFETWHYAPI